MKELVCPKCGDARAGPVGGPSQRSRDADKRQRSDGRVGRLFKALEGRRSSTCQRAGTEAASFPCILVIKSFDCRDIAAVLAGLLRFGIRLSTFGLT